MTMGSVDLRDIDWVLTTVSRNSIGSITCVALPPRFELVWLPSYCPRANPIERAFGDVHDKCTRNHKRTALGELVGDVKRHLRWNGPWRYQLSQLYYAPEVEAALAELKSARELKAA